MASTDFPLGPIMSCAEYHHNELYIENVSVKAIAAQHGTPCYIYSAAAIQTNWQTFSSSMGALKYRICYAVKANSNLAILNLLSRLNAGFDIVSAGELARVLKAGGRPEKIIFSGVGKSSIEIEQAIEKEIYCFNVESVPELNRLQLLAAKLNKKVNMALRLNPNINPHTHSYISTGLKENKFGIEMNEIIPLCEKIHLFPSLNLIGIACHIGSQITDLRPFSLAIDSLLDIYQQLKERKISIRHLNIGGGLGITYRDEQPPSIEAYAKILNKKFSDLPIEIIIEPGRAIVGNAGILLTRVEYIKHTTHKNFAIVDAGMNDLLRPALYHAWQNILAVELHHHEKKIYDIAGPVCESADFLGKDRELSIIPGDLLAIDSAGAYGFSMSSNYNTRCRPAEVLVDQDHIRLIRRRETLEELMACEDLPAHAPYHI